MSEARAAGDCLELVVEVADGDTVLEPGGGDCLIIDLVDAHRWVGVVLGIAPEVLLELSDRSF